MPQQTVYIRNGDMEKWKALENKAEFISFHLNDGSELVPPQIKETGFFTPMDIPPVSLGKDVFDTTRCPHGFAKGLCKKADCNRKMVK